MDKHPDCEIRCQYAEHKGYQPCQGFCDAAPSEFDRLKAQKEEILKRQRDAVGLKAAPRWHTSWPEWFGIEGNTEVVPSSDYDALVTAYLELVAAQSRGVDD